MIISVSYFTVLPLFRLPDRETEALLDVVHYEKLAISKYNIRRLNILPEHAEQDGEIVRKVRFCHTRFTRFPVHAPHARLKYSACISYCMIHTYVEYFPHLALSWLLLSYSYKSAPKLCVFAPLTAATHR